MQLSRSFTQSPCRRSRAQVIEQCSNVSPGEPERAPRYSGCKFLVIRVVRTPSLFRPPTTSVRHALSQEQDDLDNMPENLQGDEEGQSGGRG
jgi:hypothetical protein